MTRNESNTLVMAAGYRASGSQRCLGCETPARAGLFVAKDVTTAHLVVTSPVSPRDPDRPFAAAAAECAKLILAAESGWLPLLE